MKKIVTVLASLVLSVFSVFALDWGGLINDNTKFSTADFKSETSYLEQSNAVFFWLKAPVNKNIRFTAEGMYKYVLTANSSYSNFLNVLDFDLLKLSGNFSLGKGKFSFDAGRFFVSDSTASVFAQNSDGLLVKFLFPAVRISAYAGYTGLLNSYTVSMIDSSEKSENVEQIYKLAHGYIPLEFRLELPVLFLNQSLGFDFNAFIDAESSKASRYYGNLVLSGPFANSVYYTLSTSFGSENFKNVMNYSSFQLYWFPVSNVMLVAGTEFASGNNSFFSAFKGITYVTAYNSISSPYISSVILPQISMSGTFGKMWINAAAKYAIGLDENSGSQGLEFDLKYVYNIFTDLKVGCDVTAYIDLAETSESQYSVALNAALAF